MGDISREASEDVAKGRVIAQDPAPLTDLVAGRPRRPHRARRARPDVVVPYVIGEDKDTARQKLEDAGLRVKLMRRTSDAKADTVIRTNPNAAESVVREQPRDGVLRVRTDRGARAWSGSSERAARTALEKAGFQVDTVDDPTTKSERGTVLRQSPDGVHEAATGHHGGDHGLHLRDAHPDADTHPDPDADTYAHPDADTHPHAHPDADTHPHAHPDSDADGALRLGCRQRG